MTNSRNKEAKRYTLAIKEGTLKYAKGSEREYWKYRIKLMPIFVDFAKDMLEG